MPYDPTYPPTNAEIESAPLRSQFNGLKDLIDAIQSITAAVVDGVNTVNPGDPATVSLSVVGQTLHFSFGLPRGQDGPAGPVFGNTIVDGVTTLNPGEAATVQTSFDGSNVRFQFGIPRGNDGSNGTNGSDGMQGPPFTNFVVDGVNTLNPNDPATVGLSFDGSQMHFSFGIPRGSEGMQGSNGSDGMQGPQGPPFTNFVVDGVTTLNPNEPATVSAGFDGTAVRLLFGIPRGNEGMQGIQGAPGPQGLPFTDFLVDGVTTLNPGDPATVNASFDGTAVRLLFGIPRGNDGGTGPQGAPGEVTNAQLDTALATAVAGTSSNSNAVSLLGMTVSDPPTQSEMQALANKVDQLILALRR